MRIELYNNNKTKVAKITQKICLNVIIKICLVKFHPFLVGLN